ncbi:MAG: fibronectin type III domain-containing protein, partial [Pseudomonadota bacterium]
VLPWARAHDNTQSDEWRAAQYPASELYAPTPVPDRVVLTWNGDPATTQAVTWRTDASLGRGRAEIALASANGRAMVTRGYDAESEYFKSDVNEARYHTVTFQGLEPETLYAYRVGDGVNWTEFFHFRTASRRPKPFRFVYFGDAQNDVKTHWSRVFREAFRDAPHAAFMLHAGDLINEDTRDVEWGEWHGGAGWVNGTIPVVATPGNHEYYRVNQGPATERYWTTSDNRDIPMETDVTAQVDEDGIERFRLRATSPTGVEVSMEYDAMGIVSAVDQAFSELTGYAPDDIIGTKHYGSLLQNRRRQPGDPRVSKQWRPQFSFPVQDVPDGLEETVYYIDYQGTRFISLDSNRDTEAQLPWLRGALENNPNRWTVLTFHHPIFSPAEDRDNAALRALWKPVFDEFRVDLVLTGHDHTYARTGIPPESVDVENVPAGYQQAYDPEIGTVYVVSVSGPKMYPITKGAYARRVAEDTQLYQVIDVSDGALEYRAYTAVGELYDAFTLEKLDGQPNRLRELLPPERRLSAAR